MRAPRSQKPVARSLFRLLGLVLLTTWTGLASAQPHDPPGEPPTTGGPSACDHLLREISGYRVPGRKLGSQMPWEFFLGNASHQLIAYIYETRHPTDKVYYNSQPIQKILREQRIGDWSRLSEDQRELRPDILNITAKELFEIKPANPEGLQDGMLKLRIYLQALNQTLPSDTGFSAGAQFEGEILVQFAQGQYIWRLEWCTHTPGVTQYLWTRSQQRLDSTKDAYQANHWTDISEQDLKKYGGWVAQVVEGMVERREKLATLSGVLGVAIDAIGTAAVTLLSTRTPEEQQGTPQTSGKLLPFPIKSPSTGPALQLPKASGL